VLRALEECLKRSSPKDERDLRDMVEAAVQDVDHPGATLTLVEAMGGGNGGGAKVGSDGSNEQEITLPF